MHKKIALILIFATVTLIITSCYDAKEIDDMTYVVSIGIDKGISNKWRISFQIPLMESGGGGGSGGGGNKTFGFTTITVDAPSFFTAIELLNTSTPRRLNFMHAKYLVFSEEVAKEGLMGTIIAPMVRYREIRRTMRTIVTRGSAMEFLKQIQPFIGVNVSKSQEGLIGQSDNTGFFPDVRLNDLYNGMKSSYRQPFVILGAVNDFSNFKQEGDNWEGPPRPADYYAGEIPRQGGNKIELTGCVIGDGDKMISELNAYETRILMMARGDFKRGIFTLKDPISPEYVVIVDLRNAKKPKAKVSFNSDKPVIHEKLEFEGDIISIQSRINYEDPKLKKVVEEALAKTVKEELEKLVEKCKTLNCDVFNFGYEGVKHFNTIQEWQEYNWNKHFKDVKFTTEVKFTIRRTGSMLKSAPIITSEGEK